MGLLDRNKLLEKQALKIVKVDLGNGDFVFVRQMTGAERDSFEQTLYRQEEADGDIKFIRVLANFRAKLAVHTVCDEQGKLLLKSTDYDTLSFSMTADRLERIVNVAQKLNAISADDKKALLKNSEGAQSAASTSG